MRRLAVAALACVGCSSASGGSGAPPDAPTGAAPTIVFATSASVPGGTSPTLCQVVSFPDAPVFVTGIHHEYASGLHHVAVYRTDGAGTLTQGGEPVPCDAGPPDVMDAARATVYASASSAGALALPAGVALPMKAGEVVVIQSHYLNASASEIKVAGTVSFDTVSSDPGVHAGTYFFYDPFIDVGAGSVGEAAMRCAVTQDVTLLSVVGSGRKRMLGFEAYVDPPAAEAPTPFGQASGSLDPISVPAPMQLSAGSRVRSSCTYDNTIGTSELLQGVDALTSEQCTMSGVYYPALKDGFADCTARPDAFGTGAARCSETRACLAQCTAASSPPPGLGLGGKPTMSACWQRCIAASCPAAFEPLSTLRACITGTCSAECPGELGNSSASCASCVESACAQESTGCSAAKCGP